ncbi:MAG TPA: hypothetical protein VGP93_12430, partial [Polyangiaceae bacterium]|nr:hypothetical protein [Polyangiaceae bacterium]
PVQSALLKRGLWLDGFEQLGSERIRGWIAGTGPLLGVRVRFDGQVELGKMEYGGLERTLISGRNALVVGQNATLDESTDGGFEWRSVDLPAELPLVRQRGSTAALVNGCSNVGCAFGGWLRIGFGKNEDDGSLPTAKLPSPARTPSTGGTRWSLSCTPTGEVSPAAASAPGRLVAEPSAEGTTDEIAPGAWLPFWEEPAPRLPSGSIGFDLGTESELNQMHGYVWGPPGADWGKVGKWQVRVADRQRLQGGVWSTAVTRSPWASAELAADAFGQTQNGNFTGIRLVLEPAGGAGLLTISARGKTDLFLLEEGRAISSVRSTGAVGSITGIVKLGSGYYVGATASSNSFRIYRLQGGALELLADFPDVVGGGANATLVSSSRGNALGLWTRSESWFVYPVDLESGDADKPLELRPPASLPRPCSGDEDGWLLDGALGVEPYVDFPKLRDAPSTRVVEPRLIASAGDVCVRSLAAQAEEAVSRAALAGGTPAGLLPGGGLVPLVVSDRHELGRRWGFRCGH